MNVHALVPGIALSMTGLERAFEIVPGAGPWQMLMVLVHEDERIQAIATVDHYCDEINADPFPAYGVPNWPRDAWAILGPDGLIWSSP